MPGNRDTLFTLAWTTIYVAVTVSLRIPLLELAHTRFLTIFLCSFGSSIFSDGAAVGSTAREWRKIPEGFTYMFSLGRSVPEITGESLVLWRSSGLACFARWEWRIWTCLKDIWKEVVYGL
jgi:hypothetical protein